MRIGKENRDEKNASSRPERGGKDKGVFHGYFMVIFPSCVPDSKRGARLIYSPFTTPIAVVWAGRERVIVPLV